MLPPVNEYNIGDFKMFEFKCDKCKKYIELGDPSTSNLTIASKWVRSGHIDLCEDCSKELVRWIYGCENKE